MMKLRDGFIRLVTNQTLQLCQTINHKQTSGTAQRWMRMTLLKWNFSTSSFQIETPGSIGCSKKKYGPDRRKIIEFLEGKNSRSNLA